MSSDELNPVDVLAADFAERLKAGDAPSIEEYAVQNPDHADIIRAMFPSIKMMERVSKRERTEFSFEQRTQKLTGAEQKTLGDFRIIREVGRGGMGIVYEAEQQSLRRRVALKVLAPHISDSETQLKRFNREAKAAARLHHTNIVPVYGVGQSDDMHYIAMQFIDGITLQQKLDSESGQRTLPTGRSVVSGISRTGRSSNFTDQTRAGYSWAESAVTETPATSTTTTSTDTLHPPRQLKGSPNSIHEVIRIVRDVANALAYAHEQRVQHRDIKPGNLLLDGDGTVWITDFGLARHETDDVATRTGDIVGTIRYMAPEQFSGQEDHRSDIYSLGLTLYELLTLEPAYKPMKTVAMMQLKTNEPPPSPRAVVPTLPADLDTITLKACAVDPKHRYQTAEELEADLSRFLEDRPIHARRVTPFERLWRWAKRNPMIAGLSTATVALLITTAAVFAVGNYRTSKALESAEEQRKLVDAQKKVAEDNLVAATAANARAGTNFKMAVEAFEEIMVNISSRGNAQSLAIDVDGEAFEQTAAVVTAADTQLLETLLHFFSAFSKENRTYLPRQSADALARVGTIQRKLGRISEAREAYLTSQQIYASLPVGDAPAELSTEHARIHRQLMQLAAAEGDPESALQHYDAAIALIQGNTDSESRFELARTMIALAGSAASASRPLVEVIRPTGPGRPGNAGRNRGGGGDWPRRGFGGGGGGGGGRSPGSFGGRPNLPHGRARPTGRLRDVAIQAASSATAILKQLVADDEMNADYRLELARAYRDSANLPGDKKAKAEAMNEAIGQLEWLVNYEPTSPLFRFELATTKCIPVAENRVLISVRAAQAIQIARGLKEEYSDVPEYDVLLAKALSRRGGPRGELKTLALWEEVVEIYRKLHRDFPSSAVYRLTLASRLLILSGMAEGAGEGADAAKLFLREAIELVEGAPDSPDPARERLVQVLLNQLNNRLRNLGE